MVTQLIPPHEKRILEAHVRRVALRDLAFAENPLDEYQTRELKELIRLRMQGLPLQYLTGTQDFYGREFYVNTSVLVPRPETEGLIEATLSVLRKNFSNQDSIRGLDFGTGSGCIAATLVAEFPRLHIVASDCKEDALEVAAENLRRLNIKHATLRQTKNPPQLEDYIDLKNLDFIVSNPPYLSFEDEIADDVKTFEPEEALYAPKDDSFFYYRFLFSTGILLLKNEGFICVEIAHERAEETRLLALQAGYQQVEILNDLTGRPRYCLAFQKTLG